MRSGAALPLPRPVPRTARRRILQVISTLLPGGTELSVLRLIRSLDRERYEFHVVWLRDEPLLKPEFEAAGARVTGVGLRAKADPRALWRLARTVRRERIELVHTHMDLADWYGAAAARMGGARALVSTKHNADEFRTRRTWKRPPFLLLERLSYAAADAVIVVSEGLRAFLRRSEHLPSGKLIVLPNAVDPGIATAAPPRERARALLGLHDFDPILGTVGRLAPQKGQIDLLRAMPEVLRAFPGAACVLAGDGPIRAELEQETRRLGIAGRVVFLGFRSDVPAVLRALDLFVLPSRWEGMPLALLEAMALGLPVVAARAVGTGEVVRDGENGLLVEPGDVAGLAAAIVALRRNPERAARLGEAGRRAVVERHSLEAAAARVDRLYRRLLGEAP
ncbi:MAG: glycosyltransferase [Candidatus Polarisedimenticolia bacterium]